MSSLALTRAWGLAVLLTACGRAAPVARSEGVAIRARQEPVRLAPVTSASSAVSDGGVRPGDATPSVSGDNAGPASATAPTRDDDELRIVYAVLASPAALAQFVNPARGLVFVRYVEAPPTDDGREEIGATHLCGRQLGVTPRDLRSWLSAAARQAGPPDSYQMVCTNDDCVVPGMEYAPSIEFRFTPRSTGTPPNLTLVYVHSEAMLGEDWMTRSEDYLQKQLAAASKGCPGTRAHLR